MVTCSYKGCTNRYGEPPKISFFRFPVKVSERCLEWILRSGNDTLLDIKDAALSSRRICSSHFPPQAFMNERRNKLVWSAVPEMFELADETKTWREQTCDTVDAQDIDNNVLPISTSQAVDKVIKTEEIVATTEPLRSNDTKFRKNKLREVTVKYPNALRKSVVQSQQLVKKINNKARLLRDISKYIKGLPYIFTKMQLKNRRSSTWNNEEKRLALAFYYHSPKLYKLMLRMDFKLPSVRLIQSWILDIRLNSYMQLL